MGPAGSSGDVVPQPAVNSLLRGLEILRCFGPGHAALGSSEIARMTGLPQPTVWRLCRTLQNEGYLESEPGTNRLKIGLSVLRLGYSALSELDVTQLSAGELQKTATAFRAAAGITSRERLTMMCLQRYEEPGAAITIGFPVGSTVPIANSGVGWAFLGGLPEARRKTVIEQVGRDEPDLWRRSEPHFKRAMADFAKLGYVVNDGVIYPGLSTVAVPVTRRSSREPFVIFCAGLSASLTPETIRREVGPRMANLARRLNEAGAQPRIDAR
jgi:DNA-binding IclR family transcriptional regulator